MTEQQRDSSALAAAIQAQRAAREMLPEVLRKAKVHMETHGSALNHAVGAVCPETREGTLAYAMATEMAWKERAGSGPEAIDRLLWVLSRGEGER